MAVLLRGSCYVLAYPALSFAIVSIGYLGAGPRVFGKQSNGKRNWLATVLLLPYLLLSLATWQLTRMVSREPAVNQFDPDLYLSRRLQRKEVPQSVSSVVDLTCELSDPGSELENYVCFPILDAGCPTTEDLRRITGIVLSLPKPILIHCAQGHGRTGLLASAILLVSRKATTPREAVALVKASRPGVNLSGAQWRTLEALSDELSDQN